MPEDMPDRMPDRMPEDMSEYMPEDMPDRMPDRMPEDMSDRMPEDMPDRMPEDLPDRMPEDMPEDMPEHMPDRMPEDMSDRMPQDLPVRKCINVMVGITRSKVICFFWGMPVQWKGFGWLDYSSVGCADLEQHADSCHRWFGDEKTSKNGVFLDGSSGFTVTTCVPVKHGRSQRPRTKDFGRWEAQMLHTSHEQWGFPIHGGTPIAGWLISWKFQLVWMIWGSHFGKPPYIIYIYIYIYVYIYIYNYI